MLYAKIIVDISHSKIDKTFEYIVPENISVSEGHRVVVPFAGKPVEGIVLGLSSECEYEESKLKSIISVKEEFPAVTKEQIALAYKLKEIYRVTLAAALRFMFPGSLRGKCAKAETKKFVRICCDIDEALRSFKKADGGIKYQKQYDALLEIHKNIETEASSVNSSALKSLAQKGFVEIFSKEISVDAFKSNVVKLKEHVLTDEQQTACDAIINGENKKFLLHGVTGSGKTEIYIRIIREVLEKGKTAIMLVPEISLTPQIYRFLAGRLNCEIAVFHSGLTDKERLYEWMKVKNGNAKVVLGARSAVFAPLDDIGVIIIDEEHENSYKADNYPKYTAHEIAQLRCDHFGSKLILGSATPSVSTYYKAKQGEYKLLELTKRATGYELPKVTVIDMRKELEAGNRSVFSGYLAKALKETFDSGKQSMLFLNRRGFSTFVMCRACGHVVKCSACDVTMTYHKTVNKLKCHYCGRVSEISNICPECGKPYLKYFGAGTQQIEEKVRELLPEAKVRRMDLDTMTRKDSYVQLFEEFAQHKADILIGTQMITKGFDFKDVTLSCVLAADTMLNFPDYRSAERTFMHITQISGRAGRSSEGKVCLQTYAPGHYAVMAAAKHDYKEFYNKEIEIRKMENLPPFTNIIRLQFSGKKENEVILAVKDFLKKLSAGIQDKKEDIVSVHAHASPVKRINDIARYEIILCLKKVLCHDTINTVKEQFASFSYPDVLIGFDME